MEDFGPRYRSRGSLAFLLLLFVVGVIAGLGVLRADGLASQRFVQSLVLPSGLLWILMIAGVVGALQAGRRGLAALLFVLLAGYTAAGNGWIADQLARQVEGRYLAVDPLAEGDFDAVLVLGGVTKIMPSGRSQVTNSGDRVVLAARMYHLQRAKYLVCAGTTANPDGTGSGALEETREIWQSLGIPADKILQVPGRSTEEEMAALAALVKEKKWQRVGLITSAWHMRRAVQLAEANELNVTPLPTDFLSSYAPFEWRTIIPNPENLRTTQMMIKEMLASEVQR